jgi:hypothetical protein
MSLHLRSELLDDGFSDKELRRALRCGALGTIRRGTYVSRAATGGRRGQPRLGGGAAPATGLGLSLEHVRIARPGRPA